MMMNLLNLNKSNTCVREKFLGFDLLGLKWKETIHSFYKDAYISMQLSFLYHWTKVGGESANEVFSRQ